MITAAKATAETTSVAVSGGSVFSEMLRRLGRQLLLLTAIPFFIFVLINYRNYHDYFARRETTLQLENHTESPALNVPLPFATQRSQFPQQQQLDRHLPLQQSQQWQVLADGTVVHRGNEEQYRNYTFLINQENRCASLKANQSSFLVVVESDIINFEERQMIRDTWALAVLQAVANYRVIFLVGLTHYNETQDKLEYENLMYGDIVQIAIYEDFQNLTHKSIHMLRWYSKFCPNAQMLFKTDDDIYLHIPNIVNMLNKAVVSLDSGTILCHRNKSRKILRSYHDLRFFMYQVKNRNKIEVIRQMKKKFNKYLINFKVLPGTLYPDYCSGFGYAMNLDAAQRLLHASAQIPYIGIEDVFVTGLCREKCNLTISDNVHFRLKPIIQPIDSKCAFENGRVNSNEMTVSEIKKLWYHVNTSGYYCKLTPQDNQQYA